MYWWAAVTLCWGFIWRIITRMIQTASRLGAVSFKYCPRDANRVAHNFARHIYDSKFVINWDGDPPSFILPNIIFDVTVI